MQAEEGALTSLTALDIFSSIIIISLVFSMLPVELYSLNCIPYFGWILTPECSLSELGQILAAA